MTKSRNTQLNKKPDENKVLRVTSLRDHFSETEDECTFMKTLYAAVTYRRLYQQAK